jgi:hypothetical protein
MGAAFVIDTAQALRVQAREAAPRESPYQDGAFDSAGRVVDLHLDHGRSDAGKAAGRLLEFPPRPREVQGIPAQRPGSKAAKEKGHIEASFDP